MDEADYAQERTERQMAAALAGQYVEPGPSAHYCVDCEDPIPEARRRAYRVNRCVECQKDYEAELKRLKAQ